MVASSYIELDLFGTYSQQQLKFYFKEEDQLKLLGQHAQADGSNVIDLKFAELPILQKEQQQFFVVNDGLTAPPITFLTDAENRAFSINIESAVMPRPDVFAQAVKEQYPQICEIPGVLSQGKQGK